MDVIDSLNIITRSFIPDLDQAMIYATWRNGRYYGMKDKHREKHRGDSTIVFRRLTSEIAQAMNEAQVKIACLEDDPTIIVGYVVFHGNHLDWIYVKEDYRKQGVASLLIPKDIQTITATPTKLGSSLWAQKNKGKNHGSEGRASSNDEGTEDPTHERRRT